MKLARIDRKFPSIFLKQDRIVVHTIKNDFKDGAKVTQQKGRRVPLQLQTAVKKEVKTLLKEGHIEKINKITNEMFIQPVVITVKKDQSVKTALDARLPNKAKLKNK